MKPNTLTREEFEESARAELEKAAGQAKGLRDKLRLLEKVVADKEEKIKNYQNTFAEVQKELVKIQIKFYAGGTT